MVKTRSGSEAQPSKSPKPKSKKGSGIGLTSIATAVGYFTSAFIFLPAGRDVVSYETAILPGEAETRPLMTPASPAARTFMWGVWGLNHCALSYLKVMAIRKKDKGMLKFLLLTAALTFAYLLKEMGSFAEAGGDVMGFVVVCGLQTLSLSYLAYA